MKKLLSLLTVTLLSGGSTLPILNAFNTNIINKPLVVKNDKENKINQKVKDSKNVNNPKENKSNPTKDKKIEKKIDQTGWYPPTTLENLIKDADAAQKNVTWVDLNLYDPKNCPPNLNELVKNLRKKVFW